MAKKLISSRVVSSDAVALAEDGEFELEKPKGKAGGTKGREAAAEVCDAVAAMAEALQRWLCDARELGVPPQQLVWDLHVVKGLTLVETARLLDLPLERVRLLYTERKGELAARAPSAAADFIAMREEMRERLQATYELACGATADVRYLGVRLKALDQLTKLHGLNLDRGEEEKPPAVPYALPEDVAEKVREAVLDLHGRRADVEAARAALARTRAMAQGIED
jgi:hypothetical protein